MHTYSMKPQKEEKAALIYGNCDSRRNTFNRHIFIIIIIIINIFF